MIRYIYFYLVSWTKKDIIKILSVSHNFKYPYLFGGNQGNHKNFVPCLLPIDLWWIWIRMKQKNGRLKKNWVFQLPPKAEQLSPKFYKFLLGLVELTDGHIGWVTLMPLASINPTNPTTNLWNFGDSYYMPLCMKSFFNALFEYQSGVTSIMDWR